MTILSFILPIYNTPEKLLKNSIECLIKLNVENIEILLIDDGSKSEIADICDYYDGLDSRVKTYHQKNQGVSVARNKGILESTGKYIFFIDPDDYILDEVIDVEIFNQNTCDIILYNYIRKTKDGKETIIKLKKNGSIVDRLELIKNTLFCINQYDDYYAGAIWAKAFRRDFLVQNNIWFDEKLRKSQDRVFMLYAYKMARKIEIQDKKAYVYFENMDSICNTYNSTALERSCAFVSKVQEFLEKSNLDQNEKKLLLAKTYFISYFEVLYLQIFNKDNLDKFMYRRKLAIDLYEQMEIKNKINCLSNKDCISKGEKIKYFLIRNKCFLVLNFLIRFKQRRR